MRTEYSASVHFKKPEDLKRFWWWLAWRFQAMSFWCFRRAGFTEGDWT
jgi:hypothetical protein